MRALALRQQGTTSDIVKQVVLLSLRASLSGAGRLVNAAKQLVLAGGG